MLESFTIPDDGPKPLEEQLAEMVALKTALAGGSIRLFTDPDFTPSIAHTAASMDELEAVFPGYTEGGIEIATVPDHYAADDNKSYLVTLPSVQWNRSDTGAAVLVHGTYAVDADGMLRGAYKFETPKSMANTLDSIIVSVTIRK